MKKLSKLLNILFIVCATALLLSGCGPNSGTVYEPAPFEIHFLDVGQADSALIFCEGATMLIDGGNVADSSYLVSYLKKVNVDHLDYLVCTHAHEDHVGGLSGPLNTCTVAQVLAPVKENNTKAFSDFAKYVGKQDLEITLPTPGDTLSLGGSTVSVLGPVRNYDDTNNTSIVLRLVYGETSFLFTGDAEREAEQDILEAGYEMASTVLKAGHHGSNTSTTYPFLREIMPAYAVISVGAGNSYGHPAEAVLSILYDAGTTVYRTDRQGTVIAYSDGRNVTFSTEKNVAPTRGRDNVKDAVYIGNAGSKIFHMENCTNLPAEKNRINFADRQRAVEQGYKPCGNCKP